MLKKSKSKASWSISQPQPETDPQPQPQSITMLKKSKSKASWSIPQPQPESDPQPQPPSSAMLKKSKSKVNWSILKPESKPEPQSKSQPQPQGVLKKSKSKVSWLQPSPLHQSQPESKPEPQSKSQPQPQGVLKKSKSKVSWLQPSPLHQSQPEPKPETESKPGPLSMLKRSLSRKPSTSSSAGDKLALALVRRPQWISKVSLIPPMGICGRSSFAGNFDQFTVDTTPSDVGSDDHGEDPDDEDASAFSMRKIRQATDNLSNVFGRGMFSTVYYGTLEDGNRVAIKSDQKTLYNPQNSVDFQKKIQVLQNLDHPNLLKLYGYLEDGENSIFVTEYVRNGNLRQHLDGEFEKRLGFRRRLDIAIEVANAVSYLHANPDYSIIHGRLKSSNVLLTNSLKAMVSDFGFPPQSDNGGDASTSCVIPVVYCDPEYLQTYRFTEKSDVFSFGVVLIELLTGRPPLMTNMDSDDYVTSKWVRDMFEQGRGIDTLDPHLPRVSGTIFVAEQILALAVLCLNRKGKNRPTMSHCSNLLSQIREEYSDMLFGS